MSAPASPSLPRWRAGRPWLLVLLLPALALAVGGALAWYLPLSLRRSREEKATGNTLFQARRIHSACLAYASVRGQMPASLEDLVPDFLPDRRDLADPEHPATGEYGFLYFGSGRPVLDTSRQVLLASKALFAGRRILVQYDGHVAVQAWEPPSP